MPNQYSSEKVTIGNLLSLTNPPIVVPEFQRNFRWRRGEIETFWQDLLRFDAQYPDANIDDQEYFLGSIVLVESGTSSMLLDGQQRLATATILLAVIREAIRGYSANAAVRIGQRYIADYDDARQSTAYKLTMNRFDREFFRREVQEPRDGDWQPPEEETDSHKLVRGARERLAEMFEAGMRECGDGRQAFDWALRIQRVLTNHMSVVAVSSTDEDNASLVFETLNDRGIGLSTPDLLRMLILRRTEDPQQYEEIIESWRDVLELEGDAKVSDFLRHFWLSQKGDVKSRSLYREMRETILVENIDSLQLSRDLSQAAGLYKDIILARDDDAETKRLLESISLLAAKPLLPAVLSAYSIDDVDERRRLIKGLLVAYVRHTVVGQLETSRLENVVFALARDLNENHDVDPAIDRLRELAPDDDEFTSRLRIVQLSDGKHARHVLQEIEHHKRVTGELAVEGPDRVHVEHVYPRKPSFEKWPDHNSIVNRLGNLTLISKRLNTSIKNGAYDAKKPRYESESQLMVTTELADTYDTWDAVKVAERQEALAELGVAIWNFS